MAPQEDNVRALPVDPIEAWIRRQLAEAPPLTMEQVAIARGLKRDLAKRAQARREARAAEAA